MITTIIFDIGNVLTQYSWREHFESFGYDEAMVERIADATVRSEAWNENDRGVWSEEEVLDALVANDREIEKDIRHVFESVSTLVMRSDYAIPWIEKLKKNGYRCLYLSNFSRRAEKECAAALDFIPHMDGGILSYKDKVIKPMPEIYQLLIDRYELVPGECVFLDDTPRNVEAAKPFGMHAIQFKSQEQANEELRALGVKI